MTDTSAANRRIVRNTTYLYFRLFVTMILGLYTSRLVLQVLGVSDFGLFCVAGGILGLFTFIGQSLAFSASRFINTEMGKADGDVNRVFNVSLLIHLIYSLCILLLAETVGLWYVCHRLTVAEGKLPDAVFVYQIAVSAACLGVVNTPYRSLFTSHECFGFLAGLDIVNSLFRFVCIVGLSFYQGEYELRIYSIIMGLTTVNTFMLYHFMAVRNWGKLVRFRLVRDFRIYKEVLSFCNWNLLATFSYMVRSSGSDLLLNAFYGTSMNGALGIGKTVGEQVTNLSASFDGAATPQIIQAYAAGEKERYTWLACKVAKFSLLLFAVFFFPLCLELEYVLALWLGEVPVGAADFCQWQLLMAGVTLSSGGLTQVINASGRIKWFKIEQSVLFLLCLPVGYVLLRHGFPPYCVLVAFVVAELLQRGIQLVLAYRLLGFEAWRFVCDSYVRPLGIIIVMGVLLYVYPDLSVEVPWLRWMAMTGCGTVALGLVYLIGLTREEQMWIVGQYLLKTRR